MSKERLKFIDISRGLAIIFIVFGHTIVYSEHCKIIYKILFSFHVVLFFVLSGYTFKIKKEEQFIHFLKNKFFRIMIPYFLWAILFILPYMMFGKNTGNIIGTESSFNCFTQIKNVIYGNGNNFALKQNSSLWFLPALFSMEIIYYFIIKYEKNNKIFDIIMLLGELIISYVTYCLLPICLPWGLNTVLELGIFFHIGYLYKKNKLINSNHKMFKYVLIIYIFMIGLLAAIFNTRNVSAIDYEYGILALALTSGTCLSTVILYISYEMNHSNILEYIGKNTMGILIFHKLIILIFQVKMGNISNLLRDSNIVIEVIISVFISMLAIIFSLIITNIARKIVPILIGEQYRK